MSLAAYASETNKNVLTAAFSLAYFEIRSRNEEGINSTRKRIYSRKVFYFPLYRRLVFLNIFTFYLFLKWFSTRVSDEILKLLEW